MSFIKRILPARFAGAAPERAAVSAKDILAQQHRRIERQSPPPTAPGKIRIHLFSGHFETSADAWLYCFDQTPDIPAPLVQDLPHAYIDMSEVEVRFEDYATRLGEFLLPGSVAQLVAKMDGGNTLVIIAEPAFAGLAYALHHTPKLQYLGPMVVEE